MNHFKKVFIVFVLVSSLVIAQDSFLMAQAQSGLPNTPATASDAKDVAASMFKIPPVTRLAPPPLVSPTLMASNTLPALPPGALPAPAPVPSAPQSGSGAKGHIGLIAGLAMVGAGAGILAAAEPTHQTTCVTYGICPVPGAVHVTGGILIGVGAPLTIYKLIKH